MLVSLVLSRCPTDMVNESVENDTAFLVPGHLLKCFQIFIIMCGVNCNFVTYSWYSLYSYTFILWNLLSIWWPKGVEFCQMFSFCINWTKMNFGSFNVVCHTDSWFNLDFSVISSTQLGVSDQSKVTIISLMDFTFLLTSDIDV